MQYTSIVRKTLKVCLLLTRESVTGRRRQGRRCCKMYPERLLLWSRHFATRSPLAAAARNTSPRQIQTNLESFPNNCCILHDCRLNGYLIINMWNCYLLFELPCISWIWHFKLFLFQLVLNSMHKYQPRIHLVKRHESSGSAPITDLESEEFKTFIFPESVFTAVTAYQNQLVSAQRVAIPIKCK
jgi:hypothetical protein